MSDYLVRCSLSKGMERKGSCIFGIMASRFVVGRSVDMVAD